MFCHGHTAKTPDDTSDWIARFKDQMARLDPAVKDKYGDLFKLEREGYQPGDPNIGDSWLKWNSSLLPLRLLSQWGLRMPRKPLVVLNMCESAQVLPTLSTGFIPFFSQIGEGGYPNQPGTGSYPGTGGPVINLSNTNWRVVSIRLWSPSVRP